MSQKIIDLAVPAWFVFGKNVDWQTKIAMGRSGEGYRVQTGWLFCLFSNAKYILERLLPKAMGAAAMRMCNVVLAWCLRGAAVVVTQGEEPILPKSAKIVWETFFLPPTPAEAGRGTFERGGTDTWIRQMERYGGRVDRIAVRGGASVALVKEMYPEFAAKVVDLPYWTEPVAVIGEDACREKQRAAGPVKILFVGRAAKRKGLGILLAALGKIREYGVTDFELTVVSDLRDGSVAIPEESWVTWIKTLPHEETLKLFRAAQVFVMPSVFESYGLVYLEAMANGCVTCVRDGDPQREFVADGRAGVVVDAFSVGDIVGKLEPVLKDVGLRERLAVEGVKRYREKYDAGKVGAQWKNVVAG